MLTPDEQSAFLQSANNVQRAAANYLSSCHNEFLVIEFVNNLQTGVDHVVDEVIGKGVHIDCKAGCNHCCSAKVEAIAPEIFRIAEELGRRSAAERDATVERLRIHASTRNEESAPWSQRKSCPFLIHHLCSIYQVRPAVCRKAHSIDVEKCEAQGATIPQHLEITLNAEALLRGTSDAYRQQGFDASSLELVGAVLLAMQDPSAQSRWYGGQKVFGPATLELPKPIGDIG